MIRAELDKANEKPKEKLQSQLNTIVPMEIVRAQPFFSKNARILRDQLDEYVQGFPATRAHRKIIANKYKMDDLIMMNSSGTKSLEKPSGVTIDPTN